MLAMGRSAFAGLVVPYDTHNIDSKLTEPSDFLPINMSAINFTRALNLSFASESFDLRLNLLYAL